MASIDKEMIQKQLNKSIEILEMTFDKFNLQVIGYGFCGIQENNGWMELLIELALTPGEKLTEDIAIKANFYDEDSTIIFSNDNTIDADEFLLASEGFDSCRRILEQLSLDEVWQVDMVRYALLILDSRINITRLHSLAPEHPYLHRSWIVSLRFHQQ